MLEVKQPWTMHGSGILGPRQRLQPGGSIVCVMTRWSEKDLTGNLLRAMGEVKADQWDVIEFPDPP